MRNEIIFDSKGRPDIMVAFTPEELGLPGELRGRKVDEYLISKYTNTVIDGVPYSMPYQKPAVNIDHDEAIRLCESKGPGWHLITNDEWAALARQSYENDTLPTGNTDSGKSHSHPEQTGTTYDGTGKTLTGSGPVIWNHDGTAEGVADMCGNVWEHVGGIRFLNGKIEIIPDNGAAAGADQSPDSKEWEAIYTPDGDSVYYNVHDGEITLQPTEATEKDYDGVSFSDLEAAGMDVPDKLIELGLYPPEGYESDEYFWVDTNGERVIIRGGYWYNGAGAGVFDLNGYYARSISGTSIGFRSAFVRYSGGSGNLDNLDDEATDLNDAPQADKETIKANAEKLDGQKNYPLPDTLPGMVKQALVIALAGIYKTAGGEDVEHFRKVAQDATDDEIRETLNLTRTLAELSVTACTMYRAIEQATAAIDKAIKIATTTTVVIGKEAADHE